MKIHLLFSFVLFLPLLVPSQPSGTLEVRGQVTEVSSGKPVGVPDIKVRVKGYGWAFTDMEGRFTLTLPSDKEYVLFELEGCPHPVISPYNKLVNIPPNGYLDIRVCAAENNKLREKVADLDKKITNLERQRTLNKRQLAAMHQTLLDTILHFESRMAALESELVGKDDELARKDERIASLEKQVEQLKEELWLALQEKYLHQKKIFDAASGALAQYIDHSKNLRDDLRPVQIKSYFVSPAARERLYGSIEKYNAARREILDNSQGNIAAVANYWEAPELADELEEVYGYLLKTVHEKGVYPMEFAVNDHLKQALTHQMPSNKARKAAEEGASEAMPVLEPLLQTLEEKVTHVILQLKNNL